MTSYVKAPHGARPIEASLPFPTSRAPQGPPHIDSGARPSIYGPGAPQPITPGGLPVTLRQVGQVSRAIHNDKRDDAQAKEVHDIAMSPTMRAGTLGRTAPEQLAIGPSTQLALGPAPTPRPHGGPAPHSGVVRPQGAKMLNEGKDSRYQFVNPDQVKGALPRGPIVAGAGPRVMGEHGPPTSGRLGTTSSTGDFTARLGTSATFPHGGVPQVESHWKSKAIETTGRELGVNPPGGMSSSGGKVQHATFDTNPPKAPAASKPKASTKAPAKRGPRKPSV